MNIVKGVADLLRRSAGGQGGETSSWSKFDKLSAPTPKIRFGNAGEEAVLNNLWQRYENTVDKTEKRKLLQVFLLHFIQTYKNWEPVDNTQVVSGSSAYSTEHASAAEDVVVGCSFGHPSEVILILIQEISRITTLIIDLTTKASLPNPDLSEPSVNLSFSSEVLYVLNSLAIIIRSLHSCRVFSYYGGVQKISALLKGSVIQLKAFSGVLAEENVLGPEREKIGLLQKILVHVVAIIFIFTDLNPKVHEKAQYIVSANSFSKDILFPTTLFGFASPSEARVQWQQKAIVLVMEAGGVNWLVELLRVIRRLNMKEYWTEWSLRYLALCALRSTLYRNPRGQNHFRSIGGLEVFLDELGLPSRCYTFDKSALSDRERSANDLCGLLQLQILSLEVLRESIYGNLSNLQFLCENGRIQKFANSICSPAFILQDFPQLKADNLKSVSSLPTEMTNIHSTDPSSSESSGEYSSIWAQYCTQLSRVLCSFLLSPDGKSPASQSSFVVSFAYWELSVKWAMKVLLSVFPCIKACSSENELPEHLRIMAHNLQHYSLCAFRKFLAFAPKLLEVLREEGIWDFIFSENFFYFWPVLDCSTNSDPVEGGLTSNFQNTKCRSRQNEVDILQMEAISFLEFAATLVGNAHNLPECSVLLETLEQSACNPDIANVLVKSLHRIFELATEQTISSFLSLDGVSRVLRVACIQAHEHKKLCNLSPCVEDHADMISSNSQITGCSENAYGWVESMVSSLELFTEYLSVADNAKSTILNNSDCVDCLFDLFWEERLRRKVLDHILQLMKLPPSSTEDRVSLLHLSSKYLETFTRAKDNTKDFAELSIDLLVGMRDVLLLDQTFYQALFRDGECFLHIVSLLNGALDDSNGEQLVLNVLHTLTLLLAENDNSKVAFRALVGVGYQTLQSLLLDFCQSRPSVELLNALLDMLVDGKSDTGEVPVIKNEDVVMLFLSVLQKCSDSLQHYGLDIFQKLIKDSITNRTLCFRAGMLSFILDWFSLEQNDEIVLKLAQLIQIIGGYSVSGKNIRKLFALLRSEKIGSSQNHCSLLLASIQSMLKEKGPTAFFEFSGDDSGIIIDSPVQWPYNKGFSFSCWVRVESFPENGVMGLFSFYTDNGKGSSAMLGLDKLVFESANQKRQSVTLSLNLVQKKWHFLCITHSIGRAFSGGSLLKCYVDGDLVSSEKCRYPKIAEALTDCNIGTIVSINDESSSHPVIISSPFLGQIGPIYMFGDALSSEQVKGMFFLGPTYMYAFTDNEVSCSSDHSLPNVLFDSRDGLSSKIIFGLNAQASNGRTLFNVSTPHERIPDKNVFQATVKEGSKLCTRRILQEIIYCVGGVSVFFPLLTRLDNSETFTEQYDCMLIRSIMSDRVVAEVIKLMASILDENFANQQQMHLISGFSILGFLFQSIPPQQLNMETISSLKHLFQILKMCGMSDVLLKDAVTRIYLNPHIWLYVDYEVQRELYMFLIQQFEKDPHLLPAICGLPRVLDMIRQFYWDKAEALIAFGIKPLLHPTSRQVLAERPSKAESQKIRLLLLSFAEMSLKQKIQTTDIKALVAYCERSQDMTCVEDVLQMVLRGLSQKTFLTSFLEKVNLLGGCHIFINLLQRELEPIRLLGLQLLAKLLVGSPPEKKGQKFFSLSVGRPKTIYENYRKGGNARVQPIYLAMSDRLSKFPLSENLCATLFDALLGGASPKQVLRKHSLHERVRNNKSNSGVSSHFFLPQILLLIFNFLASCDDKSAREKILYILLDLLDSNPSNIEALMENCWYAWLTASIDLAIIKNYDLKLNDQAISSKEAEAHIVRNIYCIVLSHYLYSVKGGWQYVEETVNFLLLHSVQGSSLSQDLLLNIFRDLVGSLLGVSSEENIFLSQPCRDNMLYFLKLADEMLVNGTNDVHLFPKCILNSEVPSDSVKPDDLKDIQCSVLEFLKEEFKDELPRIAWCKPIMQENARDEDLWDFYDSIWVLLCELNGKGSSKTLPKASNSTGPSFGQRARGLVESLNIPAAEMAAVVVSGGIGNALAGKASKVDKAMLLRGEKCQRIILRLLALYLCEASFERAFKCIQQFILLLPCIFTFDDEQNKNRFHLYVWSIFWMRSKFGEHNDGARSHVISHLILEMVNHGKTILSSFLMSMDDLSEFSNILMEAESIDNLVLKERIMHAVIDEAKYMKLLMSDRAKELQEYQVRMDENLITESTQKRAFEDEIQSGIREMLTADDSRKATYQLSCDEDQQIVAEKWIHMFRALIDERGPWSANDFPNKTVMHWKLDKTEDTWRRRPKLKRNYHFDEKLCYPSTATSKETSSISVNDNLSGTFNVPEQMKRFLLKGVRGITDEGSLEQLEDVKDHSEDKAGSDPPAQYQGSDNVDNSKILSDITRDKKSGISTVENKESSEVLLSIPCVLVTPKRKLAGRLAVMQTVLHFSGNFLVEGSGGSSIFKRFQTIDNSDAFSQDGELNKEQTDKPQLNLHRDSEKVDNDVKLQNLKKRHRRWKVNKIKAVHWTRYLLQYTAIEIFFSDSVSPVFLNFESSKLAKDAGALLVSLRNEILYPKGGSRDRSGIITFVDRRVAVEMAETARESWRRRELSNFEYLMILNTLSGRSYNDLTQYPVFPWVIDDYTSEKLDFNNPSTFRDLSKPVGALNPKRFEVFEDRYRNFCDPDIPSFYYGSHYSSMGIVLFYLLRLEPFTALHRNLQGGKFDHADRLFHGIEGTYRNCMSNTSDVKELIPEFFYMPEFLQNSNSYHFGVKQDGEPLADVFLPPWAKGSPEEFIYRNREALESEFVSSNLHHWIDLVFGYKQRGKPAVEAANVFYYLTYEGAVDLESMDDDMQRAAIEDQIANFGQTPIQIFRKKHPRRGPPIPISHPLYFAPASITLTSIIYNSVVSHSSVLFIGLVDSNIVIVNEGLSLSVKMWLTTQLQSGGNLTFSSSQDPFFGIGSDVLSSRKIGAPLGENIELGRQSFATLQTTTESYLVSSGSWDNSFQVISLTDGRVVQSIRQHKDIVSCVAVTSDGSILATGSYDTTVMVWDILRPRTLEKKPRATLSELPSKDRIIVENPFHILCGHDDIITCLFVSVDLDIVISGSKDGTCIFHTLREGRYVRSIEHPSGSPLSKLVASQHGRLVVYAENDLSLHMFSINGKHMAFSESNGRLNCIELSRCGEFLVCGGDHGQIVLRSMHALEIVRRYEGNGKPITSLTVTPEECFLAGTKDGSLLVYSIENPQLRRSSLPRNTKLKASITG